MSRQIHEITPRRDLNFGLDGDLPRYWFGGDVFKTRFFDALSLLFPYGERFFIDCVRDYSDGITDPQLQAEVRNFIFQEGQHGQQHTQFNNRLKDQGIKVDQILDRQREILRWIRSRMSRKYTLAQTAASEHITAMMAHGLMEDRGIMRQADPRMRAMYTWHAVEEIEHKSVAFDVMQKAAGVDYFRRVLALLMVSVLFPYHIFMIMRHMLRVDGAQSLRVWARGLWWLYGPRGLFVRWLPTYLHYYLPGFHPWHSGKMRAYRQWLAEYERTQGDAIAASEHLYGPPAPA